MKVRKILLACACLLLFSLSSAGQTARKKVAVVLSGGGAKGMAHIGALKVIERAGIPIDIITGTSMGSIVGGLYAIGYDAERLDSIVRQQDWTLLLSDRANLRSPFLDERRRQNTYALSKTIVFSNNGKPENLGGAIYGVNLAKLFNRLTSAYPDSLDFNALPIPFACVATNIIDNSEYDFHSGNLAEAMRASMAIPAAFTPVRKGDMVLVDGGLRNNYPADLAKEMGADIIIGVTVQGKPKTAQDLTTSTSILSQIIDVNCKNKYDENLALTDVPIRVNTSGYSSASFTSAAIDKLIKRGEEEAMKHWDELLSLKEVIGVADDYKPEPKTLPADLSEPITTASSEKSASDVIQGNLGIRFDNEEMVALQLNGSLKSPSHPLQFDLTARLGRRIMGRTDVHYAPKQEERMRLSYIFWHRDMNIYNYGKRSFGVNYNQHTVEASLYNFSIRNFKVDLGARFDYYNFRDVLAGIYQEDFESPVHDTHLLRYYGRISYNSEDAWTFPTRGAKFEATYNYHTKNFVEYNHHAGINDVQAMWRMSFSLGKGLVFQPTAYGRMLFGEDVPYIIYNAMGGQWFGHYLEQQMPFAGMGHVEYMEKKILAAQLQLQQQLSTSHYVTVRVALAQHNNDLADLFDHGPMFGCNFSYAYNTMFGPLGATLGYSGHTDRLNFFINMGFQF